jgi:hypothetical protein
MGSSACVVLVAAIALAVAGTGCGGSTVRTVVARGGPVSCDSISAQPISQKKLVETMAPHGIHLYPDPFYTDCTDLAGRPLQNLIDAGPNENRAQQDEIEAREGHVFCSANPGPPAEKNLHRVREFKIRGDKTEFLFANVDCEVYTTDGNRDAALTVMRAAMADLAQAG